VAKLNQSLHANSRSVDRASRSALARPVFAPRPGLAELRTVALGSVRLETFWQSPPSGQSHGFVRQREQFRPFTPARLGDQAWQPADALGAGRDGLAHGALPAALPGRGQMV